MKYPFIILCVVTLFFSVTTRADAAVNSSLIKSATNSAVYYLVNGNRYAFPNEKVFYSWYSDFGSVLIVSAEELASYRLTGNVTYRPGRWLVKIQTDSRVYAVSHYGVLHGIASEQVATALYGLNWSTKVHDIPDTFFINYQIGAPIVNAQDYSSQTELAITQINQNIAGVTASVTMSSRESMEQKTLDLINQHRQSKGLSALVWSDAIATVARDHSENMAVGTVAFGHDGFSDRVNLLSATMSVYGEAENVAYNNSVDPVTTAVEGWLNSPAHLANIENAAYSKMGVGIALSDSDSYYFTQIFIQGKK